MAGVEPRCQVELAPKRERRHVDIDAVHKKQTDNPNNEKHVLREVGELLAQHPSILFAVRQNSGSMQYEGANGRAVPVWFYRIVNNPAPMTIVDFWGFLRDGRPFAFECKRRDWRGISDDRERKQEGFMKMIACIGGLTGFVRSAEEAGALIK